jgi:hypothetical protein
MYRYYELQLCWFAATTKVLFSTVLSRLPGNEHSTRAINRKGIIFIPSL